MQRREGSVLDNDRSIRGWAFPSHKGGCRKSSDGNPNGLPRPGYPILCLYGPLQPWSDPSTDSGYRKTWRLGETELVP